MYVAVAVEDLDLLWYGCLPEITKTSTGTGTSFLFLSEKLCTGTVE
jgi:hypothetical protein